MASITDPAVHTFLTTGTRTGKLAYTNAAGRVLVAPIWYILEDGDLIFNTGADTVKGKFLAREHQATICVDLEEPPYAFVQIQGNAELSNDPSELLRTATAIAARYMGPDQADEFGQRNGVPGELVIRLRPTKVLASFDVVA
ncbi:MAG TPA: PPOX class F420-dependent oxidoreductase [Streptosporangiaceae bacterium]|nr:PPOX class F420-dependent oxidoreductase [Streptosporangiaceae bacterium]